MLHLDVELNGFIGGAVRKGRDIKCESWQKVTRAAHITAFNVIYINH